MTATAIAEIETVPPQPDIDAAERISSTGHTYTLGAPVEATGHRVVNATDENGREVILKIGAGEGADLTREGKLLITAEFDPDLGELVKPYLPELVDDFTYHPDRRPFTAADLLTYRERPSSKKPLTRVLAFARHDMLTMAELRKHFPDGAPVRDSFWMFKRTLMALGFAHALGFVHGQVLPRHLLLQPAQHGLALLDWTQAVRFEDKATGDRKPAKADRPLYAPELLNGGEVGPAADIYMAVRCLQWVTKDTITAKPLAAFFAGCLQNQPRRRPQNAWDLKDEFDDLLEQLYGSIKFEPFQLPETTYQRKEP